jgi:hypothetical protein
VDPLPAYIRSATKFDDRNTLDLPFKRVLGSYGYFLGGGRSTVDRIDYSNDSATASIRGDLPTSRSLIAATSNKNYGYLGGGVNIRTLLRLDYSNDTGFDVRGNFSHLYNEMSAAGNNNFGYFIGGSSFPTLYSLIYRIDYSNDFNNIQRRNSLTFRKIFTASTSNENYVYTGGGNYYVTTSPAVIELFSTVERFSYSNDTNTPIIRGPLSLARRGLAATGNSNFGYFGGGTPGPVSTVDRIDYSNDTATASVRGPLSSGRVSLAATGNSNFGYFGGGGGPVSRVDRIDYSNDSATASVRGPLSLARNQLAATTNARNS